jgi:hypothetical protein
MKKIIRGSMLLAIYVGMVQANQELLTNLQTIISDLSQLATQVDEFSKINSVPDQPIISVPPVTVSSGESGAQEKSPEKPIEPPPVVVPPPLPPLPSQQPVKTKPPVITFELSKEDQDFAKLYANITIRPDANPLVIDTIVYEIYKKLGLYNQEEKTYDSVALLKSYNPLKPNDFMKNITLAMQFIALLVRNILNDFDVEGFYKGRMHKNEMNDFIYDTYFNQGDYDLFELARSIEEKLKRSEPKIILYGDAAKQLVELKNVWLSKSNVFTERVAQFVGLPGTLTDKASPFEQAVILNLQDRLNSIKRKVFNKEVSKNTPEWKDLRENFTAYMKTLTTIAYRLGTPKLLENYAKTFQDFEGKELAWSQNYITYTKQLANRIKENRAAYAKANSTYEKYRTQNNREDLIATIKTYLSVVKPNNELLELYQSLNPNAARKDDLTDNDEQEVDADQQEERFDELKKAIGKVYRAYHFPPPGTIHSINKAEYLKMLDEYNRLATVLDKQQDLRWNIFGVELRN